jgi:hypothetical protein
VEWEGWIKGVQRRDKKRKKEEDTYEQGGGSTAKRGDGKAEAPARDPGSKARARR